MDDQVLCESPLVRVTTAHGRLAACDQLPLYVFRADPPAPASDPRPPRPGPGKRPALPEADR